MSPIADTAAYRMRRVALLKRAKALRREEEPSIFHRRLEGEAWADHPINLKLHKSNWKPAPAARSRHVRIVPKRIWNAFHLPAEKCQAELGLLSFRRPGRSYALGLKVLAAAVEHPAAVERFITTV